MQNTLSDLNNYLFESLERINDDDLSEDELELEIKRAETTAKVSSMIIGNAKMQLDAMKFSQEYGIKTMPALLGGGEK